MLSAAKHLGIVVRTDWPVKCGFFAEFTLSEMKRILRLRLRMTANGPRMRHAGVFLYE
jgi:hypothetical protein